MPINFSPEGRDDPATVATVRAANAMRRINHHMHASTATAAQLEAVADQLEIAANRAEAMPAGGSFWQHLKPGDDAESSAFDDVSPLGGEANAVAPPLHISIGEDSTVRAEVEFGWAYEGPPGHVHGGFIAAAFDEVLGVAQAVDGSPGMTGTLTVRYRRPTRLHRRLVLEAWVDRRESKRIHASASLVGDGQELATAEAVFVVVDFEQIVG